MEQQFSKIWFATEKQIKNRARGFNFSDRGSLHASFGKLQFKGRKYDLSIKDIKTIDVTYSQFPSTSLILSLILSFALLLVLVGFIAWVMDMPLTIAPIMTFISGVFALPAIAFIALVQKVMLWVEVTYLDDHNVLQHAYFFDGSFLGWQGILGGSLEMYKKLRQYAISEAS